MPKFVSTTTGYVNVDQIADFTEQAGSKYWLLTTTYGTTHRIHGHTMDNLVSEGTVIPCMPHIPAFQLFSDSGDPCEVTHARVIAWNYQNGVLYPISAPETCCNQTLGVVNPDGTLQVYDAYGALDGVATSLEELKARVEAESKPAKAAA